MSVTIKVNGQYNSLAHKGSNGFAKSTAPDVCKTPSPGGPVPIPYPIIFSFSSDLKNGTKTVKADGGNMIAIKGSEFSRCTGDEPGTAGGVVSNTNMKEAKWLLYSFDVKMEGKNACRLSDKMTMNHGNTVCLQGETQAPVTSGVLVLECKENWTPCEKAQVKAKAAEIDKACKEKGGLSRVKGVSKEDGAASSLRDLGNDAARAFKNFFIAQRAGKNPKMRQWLPRGKHPKNSDEDLSHPCMAKELENNPKAAENWSADHVVDLQLGGKWFGPLRMMSARVNSDLGNQVQHGGGDPVTGCKTRGC